MSGHGEDGLLQSVFTMHFITYVKMNVQNHFRSFILTTFKIISRVTYRAECLMV